MDQSKGQHVTHQVSIVIPVYNESPNIEPLHRELTEALSGEVLSYEVIYVDDGSTDDSLSRLLELAQVDSRVVVVAFRANRGQTAAMQAGITASRGDVIVPMDADRQNDPHDIPRLLAEIDSGFDVVSGWRRDRKDKSITRVIPSKIANALISKVSGVHLHDYGCSLKAYRRDVLRDVRLHGEMHRFIPAYAAWEGGSVTEIVVNHRPRVAGHSKYGLSRTYRVLLDLMTIRFMFRYGANPLYLFGKFALFSFVVGALAFLWSLYLKLAGEKTFIETPLPLIAITALILAVMFISLGLIAEITVRIYYEPEPQKRIKTTTYRSPDCNDEDPRSVDSCAG
jgi:glycosyltransferase involved in cell wall biosynthesis